MLDEKALEELAAKHEAALADAGMDTEADFEFCAEIRDAFPSLLALARLGLKARAWVRDNVESRGDGGRDLVLALTTFDTALSGAVAELLASARALDGAG